MVHPTWIIVLTFFYGAEYFLRFYRNHNYIYFGKGLARFLLMGVYIWIWIHNPADATKMIYVRWSLVMLLSVDVFYIVQEHLMNRIKRRGL